MDSVKLLRDKDHLWQSERDEIADEIERLREALKVIVQMTDEGDGTISRLSKWAVSNVHVYARAALKGDE